MWRALVERFDRGYGGKTRECCGEVSCSRRSLMGGRVVKRKHGGRVVMRKHSGRTLVRKRDIVGVLAFGERRAS